MRSGSSRSSAGTAIRSASRSSMSKPTGSETAALRLAVNRAAAKTTTIETPTCPTSMPFRSRARRGAPAAPVATNAASRPGLTPAMRPSDVSEAVTAATAAITAKTRMSIRGVSLRNAPPCEKGRTSRGSDTWARTRPAPVPAANRSPTSAASCRASRRRPAPRAERTANSLRRRRARLTSRPATLLEARRRANAAPNRMIGSPVRCPSTQRCSSGPMLTPAAWFVSGCSRSRSPAMAFSSVRASSRPAPAASRPTAHRSRRSRSLRASGPRLWSSETHAWGPKPAGMGGNVKRSPRTPTMVKARSSSRRLEPMTFGSPPNRAFQYAWVRTTSVSDRGGAPRWAAAPRRRCRLGLAAPMRMRSRRSPSERIRIS